MLHVPQPAGGRARAPRPFKQLDKSLDEASADAARQQRADALATWCCAAAPPALVAALVYSFVRAITTVSAVIFLVTAENELATTYIIGRVGNGDYGVALAYCTVLILLMSLATALIQLAGGERKLGRRGKPHPEASATLLGSHRRSLQVPRKECTMSGTGGHRLRNITKRYGSDLPAPLAVKGISFEVPRGTLTTIPALGLRQDDHLRMIAGLETPTSGRSWIGGQDVTTWARAQRNVSMMFQSYALFPHMNVVENAGYGLRMSAPTADAARSVAEEGWATSWSATTSSPSDPIVGGRAAARGLARAGAGAGGAAVRRAAVQPRRPAAARDARGNPHAAAAPVSSPWPT